MSQSSQRRSAAPPTDRLGDNHASHVRPSARQSSHWVVPAIVRVVWRRFRADCRAIPKAAWKQWSMALAVGFGLTLLLTFGLVGLGQSLQARGLQVWDVQMLREIASAGPLTFSNAITWQSPGDLLFQPLLVVAFVMLAAWLSRPLIAASMAAAYILTFAL
jgi:hypothetical protein